MKSYKEFEEEVFNWLMKKNKRDSSFTFSLRQKANKGSETDYFIGTENSNYFGTTFWQIPISFPGSSSDLIDLIFEISDAGYSYYIQFNQTKKPDNDQNKYALEFIRQVKSKLQGTFRGFYENAKVSKMEYFQVGDSKTKFTSVDTLLREVDKDLTELIPIVGDEIDKFHKHTPELVAHRFTNDEFETMLDKLEKRRKKYATPENKIIIEEVNPPISSAKEPKSDAPLNQILYGPPGTGKTYNTVNKAIHIINPEFDLTQKREIVKTEYDRLMKEGQIVFTTFHQSLSYEDFIEGIKPQKVEEDEKFLSYEVEPGIFKTLCDNAKSIKLTNSKIDWDSPKYFKMSVGGIDRPDLHDWCIENNVIALGWGGDKDLSKYIKLTNWQDYRDTYSAEYPDLIKESRFNIQASYAFLKMRKNDIVVISKGNHIIDAIGIVKGDYYWDDKNPVDFFHFRKVEWIAKNLNTTPSRFLRKQISQMTIYEFYTQDIKKEAFKEITGQVPEAEKKPFVLIIDEINRGNISQIFGELITLIEEDKRIGKDEELEVILPYSKKPFGVPSNLYIIGTMNTADRSVEALDAALRRRFCFEEMLPKPELIATIGKGIVDGIDLVKLLTLINKRIEKLLDKDHQIGHSYFLTVNTLNDLMAAFYTKIIPLLQEYFFGDYGKIGLVFGKGFIRDKTWNKDSDSFAEFDYESASDFEDRNVFEIIDYRNPELNYSLEYKKNAVQMTFYKAIMLLMKEEIE